MTSSATTRTSLRIYLSSITYTSTVRFAHPDELLLIALSRHAGAACSLEEGTADQEPSGDRLQLYAAGRGA